MRNKVYKLLIFTITFIFIILFINNVLKAKSSERINYNFNNLTENQSIDFVKKYKIEIPAKLQLLHNEECVTKDIIQKIYNNPNYIFTYNYGCMQQYASSIRDALLNHYILNNEIYKIDYTLQDSKVKNEFGDWVTTNGYYDSSWINYNCYSYSIHRNEASPFYPTSFQYQPGNMADEDDSSNAISSFDNCYTIYDLAELVKKDLLAMGYSNITILNTKPCINSLQELICVRMCDIDYHFMRYDMSTNTWYHKPGNTAVLKYNYEPSNYYTWNNECSYYGYEFPPTVFYDSEILFIKYDKNVANILSKDTNLTYYLDINPRKDSILEINNTTINKNYNFKVSSSFMVNAELYDYNMSLINTFYGSKITFDTELVNNIYYLKVNYSNSNNYGKVTIEIKHSHNYVAPYVWKNYTQHTATCECGDIHLEPHAVSADSFNHGQRYAPCLLCGGSASIGFIGPMSHKNLPTSPNGSYILPNGVIVLVDDDVELYLNGKLTFI